MYTYKKCIHAIAIRTCTLHSATFYRTHALRLRRLPWPLSLCLRALLPASDDTRDTHKGPTQRHRRGFQRKSAKWDESIKSKTSHMATRPVTYQISTNGGPSPSFALSLSHLSMVMYIHSTYNTYTAPRLLPPFIHHPTHPRYQASLHCAASHCVRSSSCAGVGTAGRSTMSHPDSGSSRLGRGWAVGGGQCSGGAGGSGSEGR
eukprot:scaffold14437_cov124-Isochrysis_galbana.AAC.1